MLRGKFQRDQTSCVIVHICDDYLSDSSSTLPRTSLNLCGHSGRHIKIMMHALLLLLDLLDCRMSISRG